MSNDTETTKPEAIVLPDVLRISDIHRISRTVLRDGRFRMEAFSMSKKTNDERSKAAALLGSKGGKSGSGAAKRRDPEHYKVTLAEARRKAKTRRKLGS